MSCPIDQAAPYHAFVAEAERIALDAGAVIKKAFEDAVAPPDPDSKDDNQVDLVTATDRAVERLIKDRLRAAFPDYAFMGEESTAMGEKCVLTDTPTVIVDPVDGTTNFVHGFPYVCVSLGLVVNKIGRASCRERV